MRLQGKGAIVTGAAHGIGLACAKRFAKEGAYVVIADVDAEAGRQAVNGIGSHGGTAYFVETDVSDPYSVSCLIDASLEWAGRLDVLVNNAGIIKSADFLELTIEDFDAVLAVNLRGAFLMAQAAARAMVARKGGSIINMSSINGVVAIPNQVPYTVAKGGLNQLTRVMALSLANKGVRVNAIAPGSIATDLLNTVMTDDAARRKILSRTPMLRPGEPSEVANVALFLASDEASYMTGEIVTVDGGRLAMNYTVDVPD
ncbi:MAG: SDR family NAD(P)-dependent oxidoreductase [Geminicoccaceae bacterium]